MNEWNAYFSLVQYYYKWENILNDNNKSTVVKNGAHIIIWDMPVKVIQIRKDNLSNGLD